MTGIYITRKKCWAKSRKLLIEALGEYYNKETPSIILNFGNDYNSSIVDNCSKILNNRIRHIKDKVDMNHLLDFHGIPHPKTYYYPFDGIPKTNEDCVLKGRFSERARDITFTTFDKVVIYRPNTYIQDYIPFDREYRACVDWKRVIGIREKMGDYKIRNSATCEYATRHIPALEILAKYVAEKFDVDFCGIDIGECIKRHHSSYYVIELNSAPTIGPAWARKLKNDLVSLL